MKSALIGYTGFVGANLQQQFSFDALYNSKNIEDIAGRSYDLIVCAGAPGVKWKANKEPDQDWASLCRLTESLDKVSTHHLVLISTVDVYPQPVAVDEDSSIDSMAGHAYGRHRLRLEQFVQQRFDSTVIRLPGLFGSGLKKNVIYDFLHNNEVGMICPQSVYQFYYLDHLWDDVEAVRHAGIGLMNFATEGISVHEIAQEVFNFDFVNPAQTNPALYDFKTKHARVLGGANGYIQSKAAVIADLQLYVTQARAELKDLTAS